MAEFVHLHTHSHYSILDGVSKVKGIVDKTKEFGQTAVALTDHGNCFGAMEFYYEAEKAGIKPIIGSELYIAPDSRFVHDKNHKYHHLVLLAKDYQGYKNLLKLVSIGYLEGFYSKPRIDREVLRQYSQGLVAMTACLGGEIPSYILSSNETELKATLDWYIEAFGRENFYLELQNHNLDEELVVIRRMLEIAKSTGIGLVATNDSHYINREDAILQEISFALRDKTTLKDPDRYRFANNEFYLKSPEEMEKVFEEIPQAISNTLKIAEMCNVKIETTNHSPVYSLPSGESSESYFTKLCWDGLNTRFNNNPTEKYKDRLIFEIDMIKKMGYPNYFLVVYDFVNFARRQGILVGPGRGSAAGALVSYALGITDIDPIPYDLLFERFLNPERKTMPDIDIDFQDDRRDEVKEYLRVKYGYNRTADIITFGYSKSRAALKDVGRVLEIPLIEVNRITKLIDNKMANAETLTELIQQVHELKEIAEHGTDEEKQWLKYSSMIEGTIRNIGTHASGIIISDVDLTEVIPLYKDAGTDIISTQFEGDYLEKNGLLKMDLLGISNLTMIKDCLMRVKLNRHINIDLKALTFDDPKVYEVIQQGDTSGIFQLESDGMTQMLRKMKPECFEDIIAALAMYRPGPLGSGMVTDYIERKAGRQAIVYPHPDLEGILKSTYGMIVYQEQIQKIAQAIAGFTLGGADELRRAVAKKKAEMMPKLRAQFVEGTRKRGVSDDISNNIFDLIEKFAEYGFNKSHSGAYAIVTYYTAYLKTHFRIEFMASLLSLNMSDSDDVKKYCQECIAMKLPIVAPDINRSVWKFREFDNQILYGFGAIKGIGESFSDAVIREREIGGRYVSVEDFIRRMVKYDDFKKVGVEILLKAGAFDAILPQGNYLLEKAVLFTNLDGIINQINQNIKDKNTGQMGLFGDGENGEAEYHISRNVKPWTLMEDFANEVESFGFYLSRKIFNNIRSQFGEITTYSDTVLPMLCERSGITLLGFVNEPEVKQNQRGKSYIMFELDNGDQSQRFVLFSDLYDKYKDLLTQSNFVLMKVIVKTGNRGRQLEVVSVSGIDSIRKERFSQLHICIDGNDAGEEFRMAAAHFLEVVKRDELRGAHQIVFHTMKDDEPVAVFASERYSVKMSEALIAEVKKLPGLKAFWLY